MDLTSLLTLGPRAPSSANNTTPVPANLPAGCIAEFEIRGTVSSSTADINNGIWRIGAAVGTMIGTPPTANAVPPLVVYESASPTPPSPITATRFVGSRHPTTNDAVKVIAYRNAGAAGPLVAKEITFIAPAQPPGPPALSLNFLLGDSITPASGNITGMTPAVTAPGYLTSGEIWTVGAGQFRIDAPYFPAYIDANVGIGTNVTVRFGAMPDEANVARQIYAPNLAAILTTTDVNPVFDTTPVVCQGRGIEYPQCPRRDMALHDR